MAKTHVVTETGETLGTDLGEFVVIDSDEPSPSTDWRTFAPVRFAKAFSPLASVRYHAPLRPTPRTFRPER